MGTSTSVMYGSCSRSNSGHNLGMVFVVRLPHFRSWVGHSIDNIIRSYHLEGIVCTTNMKAAPWSQASLEWGFPILAWMCWLLCLINSWCTTDAIPWLGNSCRLCTLYSPWNWAIFIQPLQEQYSKYKFLSTHSWMKMLWKKISMFDLEIIAADFALEYPKECNQFIMQILF